MFVYLAWVTPPNCLRFVTLVQAEVQPIQLDFGMRQIASIPVRSG